MSRKREISASIEVRSRARSTNEQGRRFRDPSPGRARFCVRSKISASRTLVCRAVRIGAVLRRADVIDGIRHILVRHEQGAGHAAGGLCIIHRPTLGL
jgi:hypothetical protein